jgi:hypothetical protein
MRIEIFVFGIIAFLIFDAINKQKYTKMILSFKNHLKPAFWIFSIICIYIYIKKQPANSQNLLLYANNMIKSLPIDKSSINMFSPIVDFTQGKGFMEKLNNINYISKNSDTDKPNATKRSVSETKKKFVASQQGWKCNECKDQLNAWFEVDHVIRLEYGGSNGVDNLVALCRECHGRKTAMENM